MAPQHLRYLSSLPAHQVVGMPALSPTMESGTIGKWTCKVGDKISPGDSLAEVETDKATMAFEAQDEFFIAKLLAEAGAEVKVGDPILVSVEDANDIAAFASFTAPNASAVAPVATVAAPPTPAPTKPAIVEAPPAPKSVAPVVAPPAQAAAPAAVAKPTLAAAAPVAPKKVTSTVANFVFGSGVLKGALVNKLAAEQKEYIQKYGRGGNLPIKVGK